MGEQDITKTGPIGLKGLSGVNKLDEKEFTEEDLFKALDSWNDDSWYYNDLKNIGKDVEFSTGYDLGSSVYDKGIYDLEEIEHIGNVRAENQPWYSKLASGITKGTILAGTTFADGTAGLILGAINGIQQLADGDNKTGFWEGFWNNDFSKAMMEINNWAESALPNYYTEEEQRNINNGEWYKNIFTANWIGNSFIKNLGFTVGAIGTGSLVSGALKGTAPIIKGIVGSTIAGINESKIEALHTAEDWEKAMVQKLNTAKSEKVASLEAYKDLYPEAYYNEIVKIDSDYTQSLTKLQEDKAKVGNVAFALNLPITMASDYITYGKIFAGSADDVFRVGNNIKRSNRAFENTMSPINIIGGKIAEGTQEITQKAAATISGLKYESELENFYSSRLDEKATKEVYDWSQAVMKGITDTFLDPNSWEEFTIGALTSAMGMPRIKTKTDTEGNSKKVLGWEGNIVQDIFEYSKEKKETDSRVQALNERLNSPEFDNYYNGLIRHTKYQNDMSEATDVNDEFAYRNAEDSQLFSDLIMFDKAGKLEDFTAIIKEVLDTSDTNIESILKNLTNENGDSPFIENGNPLPKEEIVKKLNARKESLLNQINTYRNAKRTVETQSKGNFSEEQVDTLTWLLSKIHRNQDRFNSLADDVRKPLTTFIEHIKRTNPNELEALNNIQNIITLDNESLGLILSDLNNKKSVDTLSSLIKDFGLAYNLYEDYSTKIEDLQKLASLKEEYNFKFKEYFENPNKITQEQQKVESKKQIQKNITLQNNIDSKSVSEINKSLDDGEFDISELESITEELENVNPEELNSVQKKTKEALDIREKQKDIEKAIDKSNASEQTKEDAKKLLNNSKQQAESLEELLDLDSEAFLDSSTLLDEDSTEEFSPEELEELLAFRADQARGLLQEAISEEENVARELANMPIEKALEEVSAETTGKDQVSTVEPINKKGIIKNPLYEAFKEELNSEYGDSLRTLLQQIQTMAEQGFFNKEIFETLKNSSIYNFKLPKEVRYKIDNYINSNLLNNVNKDVIVDDKISEEENIDDIIDTSDESLLNSQKHKEDSSSSLKIEGILQAWLSPYTQYYRYAQKGDRKPFIEYAKESGKYTEAELKRIEAIYNYFINHNVFSNINNGAIKVGDKVTFFTDETLNNDAEDFVILMKSNGIVVGALPPIKLAPNYIGLSDFITEFKEAYEASNKGLEFTYGESEVMQNMVGRVPYDMEGLPLNTLNTIYQGNNFTLGISRSEGKNAKISIKAGKTRSFIPKASDPESRVLSPLDAKKGQPYLMIESSDPKRQYIPIPFIMPVYSVENTNSLLGQAINSVLEKLRTAKSSDTLKIKQELQELLSISEVYLEIKDGNVLMRIKPIGASKFTTILNSPQLEENIVEYAKKGLYGQPFQVSVKYINSTYKGQSYNNMIGEIAKTNLPVGEHHTIDDWFTIRPVGKKGFPIRTTKNNPNKAKPVLHEVTIGKDTYKVNLNTFDAYKLNAKGSYDLIIDSSADIAKAIAYGYKTSTTEDVYKTEWGLFDSKSEKFVKEEAKENIPIENNMQDLDTNVSNQLFLLEQAKNAKLLTTEKKRRVWEALNDNYKQKLLGYTGLKQKQMMEGLERAYKAKTNDFDLSKLKGSLDSYFEIPLYRKEEFSEKLVSVDKEIKWLNVVLPQLDTEDKLRLVEGLIKISKEDGGGFAWGQFKQGIITLPKVTAKGTVYHEAFHAVVHTLLSDSEINRLFEAAKDKYGDLDSISLEENLAEDFRRYIQLNELDYNKTKLQRFIDNIFRTIKNIINKIRGKESYIDNLFYRINNGNYANRISNESIISRNRNIELTPSRFQQIADSVVNNATHTAKGRNDAWRHFTDTWLEDGIVIKGYKDKSGKYKVASVTTKANEEKAHYRKVEQHYRDKYNLSNLSNEDLQYLHDRNLLLSEYNKMSSFEKEILFHCK